MKTRKFWLWDFDPEGEVYENLSWDLPGYQRSNHRARRKTATNPPKRTAVAEKLR